MTDQPMASAVIHEPPVGQASSGRAFLDRFADVRRHAWIQPVTFIGLGMLAVVYATLALLIADNREDATANAIRDGENLVEITSQSYSHIFQNIDTSLLFLRRAYSQTGSLTELQAWLSEPAIRTELGHQYGIIDAQGQVVAISNGASDVSVESANSQNFSGREYFRRQRDAVTDELAFSEPFVSSISGRTTMLVTRRLTAADGAFAGVVVAIVNPDALTKVGTDLDLGEAGSFGLIGLDGVIRARAVGGKIDQPRIGTKLPPNTSTVARASTQPNGHYWTKNGFTDDAPRLLSYRVVGDYPMVATVARTASEIFQHANRQAKIYWSIALLITVVIFLGIKWGIAREQKLMTKTAENLKAQEDLHRSQERYRLAEQAVNDGIWDWNIETGASYKSPRWNVIMGMAETDQAPSFPVCLNLIHPEDRPRVDQIMAEHLDNDKLFSVEYRIKHADGDYRWVQSRGKAQRDCNGKPVRMVGTVADITERMQAEATFKESRDNLARAERLALLGHFRNEIASKTLTWSEGVYAIFGFSPKDNTLSARTFFRMVLPEDRKTLKKARNEVVTGLEIPNIIVRSRRPDGAIIDLELWITPVRDDTGAITSVFGTIQDVTIRRRAEELLSRANQELEARVSARTEELAREMRRREETQMTLGQMQKMEAVGQLTAGVAHDFNNLLSVIAGSLEFVDRAAARGLTADPELVDAAMRATRRGRELVRRLLAFSRQSPLRAEPTPIDQMVLDTLRLLQRTLGQNIELATRLNARGAVISVDRNQLANALLNLALNARDAMPDGGQITIATELKPCDPAAATPQRWPTGEEVCITISDTGVGMTQDVLARAAEPFFTTKADGLGSGLGLSMVQGFTEQSGGLLNIDSRLKHGTSVTLRLPRVAMPGQMEEEEGRGGPAVAEREHTVLLVEDDADVRVVVTAQLRHLGYKVHAVTNGMEAIDLIASPATIDILLTDIVLPGGLDGVGLVKESMATRPGLGILCMSGYDPAQKQRKWLKMQNITFLEKPFTMQMLSQALESALAR